MNLSNKEFEEMMLLEEVEKDMQKEYKEELERVNANS